MAKRIVFLLLFIIGSQARSQATGLSAQRKPGVSYRNYLQSAQSEVQKRRTEPNAERAAGPWNKLDINSMEEWKSFQTVEEAFKKGCLMETLSDKEILFNSIAKFGQLLKKDTSMSSTFKIKPF